MTSRDSRSALEAEGHWLIRHPKGTSTNMLAQQRKLRIHDMPNTSAVFYSLTAEIDGLGLAPPRQPRKWNPGRDTRDNLWPRASNFHGVWQSLQDYPSIPGPDLARCRSNGSGSASLGGVWADRAPGSPLLKILYSPCIILL